MLLAMVPECKQCPTKTFAHETILLASSQTEGTSNCGRGVSNDDPHHVTGGRSRKRWCRREALQGSTANSAPCPPPPALQVSVCPLLQPPPRLLPRRLLSAGSFRSARRCTSRNSLVCIQDFLSSLDSRLAYSLIRFRHHTYRLWSCRPIAVGRFGKRPQCLVDSIACALNRHGQSVSEAHALLNRTLAFLDTNASGTAL